MTTPFPPEIPPVRLPGQQELPCDVWEPSESQRHRVQADYLVESLRSALSTRSDAYVAGRMGVYFSRAQLSGYPFRSPDVFVAVGTEKRPRQSWVYWEEMRLPDIVIEVTSPMTREDDLGRKKNVYEKEWKAALYVVYEPFTRELFAWQLCGGRYVPTDRTAGGDIVVPLVDLRLGVRPLGLCTGVPGPSLRWIGADGEPLATYEELAARIARAEARLAALRDPDDSGGSSSRGSR